MFLRFAFEGTGLLSSPQRGEQSCSERNAPKPAFRAGGQRSGKQCSDTKHFVARNCREATRSAESRRMNTTEINVANVNNAALVGQAGYLVGTRISRPFSKRQLMPG
jgi:hypothetical protein